ncbi:MAG: peptide-methionine (S)-S-oxide reductase MsrA [Spirochaetaceae bacterium]|jgi:methionine-S-sulfoxide reductase|nr:peptide-methionine (S)-S-oxide reductase MsrA [Spirochaetaceae bacterium]
MKEIYLAGGCFWGAEKYLSLIPGVLETEVGYANGNTANPSYEDVRYRGTGHTETVRVRYDEGALDLGFLLELFFKAIDPLSLNRQGHDEGINYRTGVYYTDGADRPVIDAAMGALQKQFDRPVVVEVLPLENYYSAEEYHQKYLDKNPTGYCHVGSDTFAMLKKALEERAR